MARTKSLLITTKIDEAKNSHNCQADSNHRIHKGDKRLKVRNGKSWDHYCSECAKNILVKDFTYLNQLHSEISCKAKSSNNTD